VIRRGRARGRRADRYRGKLTGAPSSTLLTFDWGEPGGPDLNDATPLVLGVKFSLSEDAPCVGVEWRAPDTPIAGDVAFSVWNFDTQAKLNTVTQAVTTGGLQRALFAVPTALTGGQDYLASIHTPDGYVGTFPYTWPHTDGILTADADNGWFVGWPVEVFPNNQSGNDANYHVSPVIEAPA
jgi:hypothetical protein